MCVCVEGGGVGGGGRQLVHLLPNNFDTMLQREGNTDFVPEIVDFLKRTAAILVFFYGMLDFDMLGYPCGAEMQHCSINA